MDAAAITWRPLGRLLVEKGLLTDAELEQALADQARTGRRLGQIIVERGYVSGPALTSALAEQYGIDLSTESGFGSGLRDEIERRHQARRPVLRVVRANAEPEIIEVTDEPGQDAESLRAQLDEARTRLAGLEPRLEEQWALLAAAEARIAELEAERRPAEPEPVPAHLLFAPNGSGYRLVERDGPPPLRGRSIELDGRALVVAKIGRSPLPGDRRPCAYLVAATSFGTASSL